MPTLSQRVRHMVGDAFGASLVEENIEKALKAVKERIAQPESHFYDQAQLFMGHEWLSKGQATATYEDLRAMAKNPIVGAIIQTRLNQVAAFCRPQLKDHELGYRVEPVDPEAKPDKARAEEISDWVYSMGTVGYGEPLLETFARKFIADSLILDQACAEVVHQRDGLPAYAVPVDGATIRRLKPSLEFPTPNDTKPWFAQVLGDKIVNTYTREEMIFAIRNPRTDIKSLGYGFSELETLIRTVSSIVNTEKYNSGQLLQGGTQKGVLVVRGDADQDQFNIFKRDFREAIRNAASQWRPPVLLVGKDAQVDWVTLDRSNRDMEYAALFDFLVKQACGVYQIDPAEINWSIGQTGTSVVFNGSQADQQLASKERGLRPLLTFFFNTLNGHLISKLDPNYRLKHAGLDEDRQVEIENITKEAATLKTLNEVRADRNLPPLKGGNIILNPVYLQALTLAQQEAQAKAQEKEQEQQQAAQEAQYSEQPQFADQEPENAAA